MQFFCTGHILDTDLRNMLSGRDFVNQHKIGAVEDRVLGDSNGDEIFNSSNLVAVFRIGEYEDGISNNSTFEEGDWNGDGDFDSGDLVAAFQAGTYVAESRPFAVAAAIDRLFDDDDKDSKRLRMFNRSFEDNLPVDVA